MHKRNRLHAFAVISCLAMALAASAQETARQSGNSTAPAAEPVKVAAHSSRWDYPKEISPAAGQKVHIVEKGDTLWDLGARYLGNPFAWPQIWELNKWVKDPHWIYPGDPILIDVSRSAVAPGREQDAATAEVTALRPDVRRLNKPVQDEFGYSFQDFIQLPFIAPQGADAYFKENRAFPIQGHQAWERSILADGDTVYLKGGSDQGAKVGDRLVVTKVLSRKFHHPDDHSRKGLLGDVLQQEGVVRIVTVYPDASVAVIEHALDGIYEGAHAVPFTEPANIVAKPRTDIGSPVPLKDPLAKVIFVREDRPVGGAGDLVIIDQGARHGLKVGEILISARRRTLANAGVFVNPKKEAGKPSTNYYLGQMMVVRTEQDTATCRLLRTREEVMVGDIATR
ncbi:peptidoglycan-binding protein LysM [Mesoterricola sediminis]|uniref:Peptidoglycan-binding protein LysM n=2 Tax=Mesoterricola sediminis TaxID=2927980 RepID=A0AA48KFL5_9BACT|nr:peptidoglycan-binding protein LysM [Mesoterricola sediminis]